MPVFFNMLFILSNYKKLKNYYAFKHFKFELSKVQNRSNFISKITPINENSRTLSTTYGVLIQNSHHWMLSIHSSFRSESKTWVNTMYVNRLHNIQFVL